MSDSFWPHGLQHARLPCPSPTPGDCSNSCPSFGEGNGNPLRYSCLQNPMDRGVWWAAVCGVTQSRTRLKRLSSGSMSFKTWCHPTISSSVFSFSSCLQSFPASGSFPMSQFFASGGQSFGVSASASVLPMTIQDWFPLGWTGWISLLSRELSRVLLTPQFKSINSSALSFLYRSTLTSIHDYWKNHGFD